jgi:hypothetical protein
MKRTISLSVLLLLLAATVQAMNPPQDAKNPNMFPFAKGSQWHFEANANGTTFNIVQEVTEFSKNGETTKAKLSANINGQDMNEEMSSDAKGIYRHSFNNINLDKPLTIFKYPIQNQKWSETVSMAGMEFEAKMEMKSPVDLTVGAGSYKKVIPVEINMSVQGQEINATNYYAEDVGIVKQEMSIAGTKVTSELKKYVKGDK